MSLQDTMNEKVLPLATKFSQNKFLMSIRDGFMVAFPATMFASIMIIIQNLPTTFGFAKYMPQPVTDFLNNFLGPVSNATMNITSLFVVFGVAYALAGHYHATQLYAGRIALSAFFMLLPIMSNKNGSYVDLNLLGSKGMFVALLTGIFATVVYSKLENANITIKMPESVPPAISQSFIAVIPGAGALLTFTFIRWLFTFTAWGNAFDFIYDVLQVPIQGLGATLPATILVVFFSQFLWWFGLHGTLLVNSVVSPIYAALDIQNYNAYQAGKRIPHIICSTFAGSFEITGMILAMSLAGLYIAKSSRLKHTMELTAVPSVFNISEPMTFGVPMVLNPTVFIPWTLAPVLVSIVSYFAFASGLVPYPTGATVVWSTPFILQGWLATGSWRGAALQIVMFILFFVIWFPFLKVMDKQYLNEEKAQAAKTAAESSAQ